MCGRLNISDNKGVQTLLDGMGIGLNATDTHPKFNVSPGASLATLHAQENKIYINQMHWGITPRWTQSDKILKPLINARAETIWEKPSFKALIKSSRAVIPVNGFYEWRKQGKQKQAFYIEMNNLPAMALAAIYSVDNTGEPQICVVTTQANKRMADIHSRMPVLLSPDTITDWLNSSDRNLIDQLCLPVADEDIQLHEVSSYVNNARNDGPECCAPASTNRNLSLL